MPAFRQLAGGFAKIKELLSVKCAYSNPMLHQGLEVVVQLFIPALVRPGDGGNFL
jgi:hypothetical protein